MQRVREVVTDGAAILRKRGESGWAVWPLGRVSALKVDRAALGLSEPLVIAAHDRAGEVLSRSKAVLDRGVVVLPVGDGAFRYEISGRKAEGRMTNEQ